MNLGALAAFGGLCHAAERHIRWAAVEQLTMREFLVVYDYGQGGVWAYVSAESASAIESAFPELSVVQSPPAWLSDDEAATLERVSLAEPSGILADLLQSRESAG